MLAAYLPITSPSLAHRPLQATRASVQCVQKSGKLLSIAHGATSCCEIKAGGRLFVPWPQSRYPRQRMFVGRGGLAAAYSRFRAVSTMRLHPTGFPWRGHARDGGIKSDDAQVRGWAVRSFSQFSD